MSEILENVLIVEKMMDLERVSNPKNTVLIGPNQKTVFSYPATANPIAGSIIFNNICAPSLTTVMKRTLRVQCSAVVTVTTVANNAAPASTDAQFNGVAANGSVFALTGGLTNANACLRAQPLASVITSADVRLNGGATNCALNTYNCIYPFLQGKEDINRYGADMPLQPDNSSVYENASATNPFNGIRGNSSVQSRGAFLANAIITTAYAGGVSQVTQYTINWVESLVISPFLTGHADDDVGLVNVNNLTVALRLGDLKNMLSLLPTVTTGGISVSLQNVNLLVEFCSQNSILAQRTPQTAVYPYHQIQTYQTPIVNLSGTISLQALRLPCQPSKMYLFIGPTERNPNIPDHFLRITNISVNFNDKNSLLNGMTEADIYEMSARNVASSRGSFMNFAQYRFGCGSIVCIDVQRDLSVSDSSQSGSQNQFSTLQVTLTYNNNNCLYAGQALAAGNYNAFQVVVSPGKAFVSPSSCEFSVLGPSPAEVLSLTADIDGAVKVPEEAAGEAPVDGKGFSDLLSKGLSLAYEHRDKIMEHAAPHLMKAGQHIIRKFRGGAITGGATSAGDISAGALSAGHYRA